MPNELRGWHPDPFGAHELRYFALNGKPTRLVRDAHGWSHDLPADAALSACAIIEKSPRRLATQPASTLPTPPSPRVGQRHDDLTSISPADAPENRFLADAPWRPLSDPETASESRRATLRRFIRYGSASAITTALCLTILGVLVGPLGFAAIWANLIATAVGTVPSFELNRRWVWTQNGGRSLLHQVIPFSLLSFAGLVLSTITVHVASDATVHSTRLLHTASVEIASIGSSGLVWLIQYVLCDRILFRARPTPSSPVEWDDLAGDANSVRPRVMEMA
jgi:putative flippase GtrA